MMPSTPGLRDWTRTNVIHLSRDTLPRCFSSPRVAPELLSLPDTVRCAEFGGGFGFARRGRSAEVCVQLSLPVGQPN